VATHEFVVDFSDNTNIFAWFTKGWEEGTYTWYPYATAYNAASCDDPKAGTGGSGAGFYPINTCNVGCARATIDEEVVYRISRAGIFLDTSVIPEDASIVSAVLNTFMADGWYGCSARVTNIVLQNGQPTYPHIPAVFSDYNKTYYSGNGGSILYSDIDQQELNAITLNATGRTWVKQGDGAVTKLMIRLDTEIAASPPSESEDVLIYSLKSGATGNFTVTITVTLPAATTDDATDLDAETGTGTFNGEITDKGIYFTSYGFEWKEGEEGGVRSVTVGYGSDQSITTFEKNRSFDIGVTYYYRAWCRNEAGKGYGEWVEFIIVTASVTTSSN